MVSFFTLWQIYSITKRDATIVSLERIGKAFISIIKESSLYTNIGATLKILLIGIGCAIVFGIAVGILIDLCDTVKQMITPLIELFRNIPSITLFPILLVAFGIGDMSRIFVIFWTSAPAIILSTVYGLRTIDATIIEASQSFGANKLQIMWLIKLPLALPEILNGIKIAIGSGFVAIVVAEMLGASKGLGFMVLWTTNSFKYHETYAYILIIAIIGAMANWIMSKIIKHYERNLL